MATSPDGLRQLRSSPVRRTFVAPLTVLLLWINGYHHDFTTDEGFDLVVGVVAGNSELRESAGLISVHVIPRYASLNRQERVWKCPHPRLRIRLDRRWTGLERRGSGE